MAETGRFQFSLSKLMLWVTVCAIYTSIIVASEPANLEWLAVCCWPVVVAAFRVRFSCWIACHFSAIGAGLLLVLGLFFPDPSTSPFEVTYTFTTGCGIGYLVFLFVEAVCRLIDHADGLMRRQSSK